jgi:FixJ family two-component response regulator
MRKTIYFVEDNELYSMMLNHIMEEFGSFDIMNFTDAEECIEHIKSNQATPALVILDYMLPGMSGMDALLEIKKINKEIPVIILSSQADVQLAMDFIKNGAEYVIEKKGKLKKELIETIEKIIS